MSSIEQGACGLEVGGGAAAGGGSFFPPANAASILAHILVNTTQQIVPAPAAGFAHLVTTLAWVSPGAGNGYIEVQDSLGYGAIANLTGGTTFETSFTGNFLPFYVIGAMNCHVGGGATAADVYGEYVTFSTDGHDIQTGLLSLTTSYQTVPNIVPTDSSKVAVPFAQTWVPGQASQLDFVMNVDTLTNTVRFKVTRGATIVEFDLLIPTVARTQLNATFPALLAGDVVEAKLLSAPATPGQIFLRMLREFVTFTP